MIQDLLAKASWRDTFVVGIVGIFALIIYRIVFLLLLSPLRRIPGPKRACLSDEWINQYKPARIHESLYSLHQVYGPVLRTGPNRVHLADPRDLKIVYSQGTSFLKTSLYDLFGLGQQPNVFSMRDRTDHAVRRKALAHAYSKTMIMNFEQFVKDESETLRKRLEKAALTSEAIDLSSLYKCTTADTMLKFGFGISDANMINNGMHSLISNMESAVRLSYIGRRSAFILRQLHMTWFIPYMPKWMQTQRAHDLTMTFSKQCSDLIQDLLEKGTDNDAFKNLKNSDLSIDDIASEARAVVVAGTDTTAMSLTFGTIKMFRKPNVLAKLRKELRESKATSYAELSHLPYLNACMYEILRLHPAVAAPLPRYVPKGGVTIRGYYLPEGTEVGMSAWVNHRYSDIWGDDPMEFNPDRWIDADPSALETMKSCWVPFSTGSRQCLGQNLARLELLHVMKAVFENFELDHFVTPDEMLETICPFFAVMPRGGKVILKLKSVN